MLFIAILITRCLLFLLFSFPTNRGANERKEHRRKPGSRYQSVCSRLRHAVAKTTAAAATALTKTETISGFQGHHFIPCNRMWCGWWRRRWRWRCCCCWWIKSCFHFYPTFRCDCNTEPSPSFHVCLPHTGWWTQPYLHCMGMRLRVQYSEYVCDVLMGEWIW